MLGSLEEERVLESENTDALVKKSRLSRKVFRASSHLHGIPIYEDI